jgi:septal ring factor EnvC (AmiA/AmiB activator)
MIEKIKTTKNKKFVLVILGTIMVIFVLMLLLFLFQKNSDAALLNDLQQQISDVETTNTQDDTTDTQIADEINTVTGDDVQSLDDLEAQFNQIMDSLDQIETAESNIGTATE